MNPPQVYMCSPSWTLLPPPSPLHPSGSSQCTSPKHPVSCIEPGLATRCFWVWWWWFSLWVVSNPCDCMDYSPPCSSVHGISQARIPEWVSSSFSRGSSWPRDWTHVSCTAGRFFTTEPPGKPCFCVVFCKFNHLSLFSQMYCDMIDKWKLCVCSVQHGVLIYLCALWKITKIELN